MSRPTGRLNGYSGQDPSCEIFRQFVSVAVQKDMKRGDVISRIKSIEPALRARGVAALYLFGSHGRDEAQVTSDIDVFVDAGGDRFYDLSNFMGAYEDLRDVFPDSDIGYSARDGLSKYVRSDVEPETVRVF